MAYCHASCRSILQVEAHDDSGILPIKLFGAEAEKVTNIKAQDISTMHIWVQYYMKLLYLFANFY